MIKSIARIANSLDLADNDSQYNPIFLSITIQVNDEVVLTVLPVAFEFITPYRTRGGLPISVIFACGPDVAMDSIIGLLFLTSTDSILDMNDNILDMTKVNERPFPIEFRSSSNSTPVVGTHATRVKEEQYGKFLKDLNEVEARVFKSLSKSPAMDLQGGKKICFAENVNVGGAKRIRLNEKPNTTSTDTSMALFNNRQAGVPNGGTQLPEFGTAIPNGDLPSVEDCTGYSFGGGLDTGGKV